MKMRLLTLLVIALIASSPVHANKLGRVLDDISRGLEENQETMRRWDAVEASRKRADARDRALREQQWFDREIAPQFPTFVNDRYTQPWKDYLATPLHDGTDKKVGHRLAAARGRFDTAVAIEIIRTYYARQAVAKAVLGSLPSDFDRVTTATYSPDNPNLVLYHLDFSERLPRIAAVLNKRLPRLPLARLESRQCGRANAYYAPANRTVTFCYEMANHVGREIQNTYGATPHLSKLHHDYVWFILFHEVGHMLLDGQPALGREEDNADLIAIYLLPEKFLKAALLSAIAMHKPKANLSLSDYARKHTVDGSRRANIGCWLYGRAPAQFADMRDVLTSLGLSDARLRDCPAEYSKQRAAVSKMLQSYM